MNQVQASVRCLDDLPTQLMLSRTSLLASSRSMLSSHELSGFSHCVVWVLKEMHVFVGGLNASRQQAEGEAGEEALGHADVSRCTFLQRAALE